jgi:hypothetical protein
MAALEVLLEEVASYDRSEVRRLLRAGSTPRPRRSLRPPASEAARTDNPCGHRRIVTTEIYTQAADEALKSRVVEQHSRKTVLHPFLAAVVSNCP